MRVRPWTAVAAHRQGARRRNEANRCVTSGANCARNVWLVASHALFHSATPSLAHSPVAAAPLTAPIAQLVHSPASKSEYLPGAQLEQRLAPSTEYIPDAQFSHTLAPAPAYLPAGQKLAQLADPAPSEARHIFNEGRAKRASQTNWMG